MTSATGSVSFNGSQLLGGTAGKIDTDALIDALMAAVRPRAGAPDLGEAIPELRSY
jgi:hypothetical protein